MSNIKCKIESYRRLKNNMKIVFTIDEKHCGNLTNLLDQYMEKPLLLNLEVDIEEKQKQLAIISPEQRKKIFALLKDIAEYSGENKDSMRDRITDMFCCEKQIELFSLSDCSVDVAGDYIEWLIEFCFEHGVSIKENPVEGLNDIENYVHLCLHYERCAVCGQASSNVKWSEDKYIPLCSIHKSRAVKIGKKAFEEEFHVYGVSV